MVLEIDGEFAEARQHLEKALEKRESLGGWFRENVFLTLGRVSIGLELPIAADEWFERATAGGVERWFMLGAKAGALWRAGNQVDALAIQ